MLHLEHEFALLSWNIEIAEEELRKYRSELRDFHFDAVVTETADTVLYASGQQPQDAELSGHNWRIKVTSKSLDVNRISLIGGGAVVGIIPSGLPAVSLPRVDFSAAMNLASMAIIISLLGFMENRTASRSQPGTHRAGIG